MIHLAVPNGANDASLLAIRLLVGLSFIVAARNKGRNIRKFARNNGLPVPVALGVMIAELTAGTALVAGILPQIAALVLMVLMLGTLRLHIFVWKSPYWASQGGWEYDLMLLIMGSVIAVHGGGRYAILK